MTRTYLTREGDVLDAVVWRYYGAGAGRVEAVLAANPGLADRGPVLPAGVTVVLPELALPATTETVRLWT